MQWLLRLYPRAWRERYETEMLALLEAYPATWSTAVDLLIGALDANLHYGDRLEGVAWMLNRLRSGVVMVFCAFMMYGLGWGMLQRVSDPMVTFRPADAVHPALGVLIDATFVVGCLAFIAFLAGGLPLLFIAVRRAMHNQRRDILKSFYVALSSLGLFVIATAVIAVWHPERYVAGALISYMVLFLILLLIGTVAVSLVIARTDFKASELRLVLIPEALILLGMVASVVVSVANLIAITGYAPQLLTTQDVSTGMFVTGIALMMAGTLVAWLGLRPGLRLATQT